MARKDQEGHMKENVVEHLFNTKNEINDELAETKAKLDTALKKIEQLTLIVYRQFSSVAR